MPPFPGYLSMLKALYEVAWPVTEVHCLRRLCTFSLSKLDSSTLLNVGLFPNNPVPVQITRKALR